MSKRYLAPLVSVIFLLGLPYSIRNSIKTVKAQTPDTTPPTTTLTQTPDAPDGNNGWYISTVNFLLQATDLESGVQSINYRVDSGNWQTVTFLQETNQVLNPSFEDTGATSTGMAYWELTVNDPEVTVSQDLTDYAPGYATASAKLLTTGGSWHGINNKLNYVTAAPFENMTASAWVKISDVSGVSNFKIYAILDDDTEVELIQSSSITGTQNWAKLSVDFTVTEATAKGVYIDIGHVGPGTVHIDAVEISSGVQVPQVSVDVASDSANHRFEYYSVDFEGNTETYSCVTPIKNCVDFKIDQTAPGNWHDSGAFRGFFGSDHELWVYTTVEDETSGLSVFSDKYQYHTEREPGFGRYSNLSNCNSTWQPDIWTILITPPFNPGANSAFLLTPKTDFCNSNWKQCKIVKFYVEDMAGNSSTKDFCINGPWIQVLGGGIVRANHDINMLSEPNGDNTDGLIMANGSMVTFFTSEQDWIVKNAPSIDNTKYTELWDMTNAKTEITNGNIPDSSGIYNINGNYTLIKQNLPNNYKNLDDWNTIIFIDGDLQIDDEIEVSAESTMLFVVSGNVNIDDKVDKLALAIIADGDINTAWDAQEGDATGTLDAKGLFHAENFAFRRTLQGTNNNDDPSESFTYEPKYLIQLKEFFDNNSVRWIYN